MTFDRTEVTITPALFIESFHIPVENLIKPVLKQMDTSQWDNLKNRYKEFVEYENDLIEASGDGYRGLVNDELREIQKEAEKVMRDRDLYDEINEKIIGGFFSYDKSTIHDLSVQKSSSGEKTFYKWNTKDPITSFDFFDDISLIFSLGGKFYE